MTAKSEQKHKKAATDRVAAAAAAVRFCRISEHIVGILIIRWVPLRQVTRFGGYERFGSAPRANKHMWTAVVKPSINFHSKGSEWFEQLPMACRIQPHRVCVARVHVSRLLFFLKLLPTVRFVLVKSRNDTNVALQLDCGCWLQLQINFQSELVINSISCPYRKLLNCQSTEDIFYH